MFRVHIEVVGYIEKRAALEIIETINYSYYNDITLLMLLAQVKFILSQALYYYVLHYQLCLLKFAISRIHGLSCFSFVVLLTYHKYLRH
jgi:hypothetical protein